MAFFDFHKMGVAKMPLLRAPSMVRPEKVPATMYSSPEDFGDYKYSGPAVEKVTSRQGIRHPALVARLIRKYRTDSGVSVEEEMTASVKDLKRGAHPQAEEIASALSQYFETKFGATQKSVPHRTSDMSILEGQH